MPVDFGQFKEVFGHLGEEEVMVTCKMHQRSRTMLTMSLFHISIVKEMWLCSPGSGGGLLIDLIIQNPLSSLFVPDACRKGECRSSPGVSFCGAE